MNGGTPKWIYDELAQTRPPCERREIFHDHECKGRTTREHVWIYAGSQIKKEVWAIIHICAWAHDVDEYQGGGNLDKEKNEYISLLHATQEDLAKYPKFDWLNRKRYLISKYGTITKKY